MQEAASYKKDSIRVQLEYNKNTCIDAFNIEFLIVNTKSYYIRRNSLPPEYSIEIDMKSIYTQSI